MNMLRSIREKKGLSVGQLAARSSIPSRILLEYEEGRQPIPLPHAKLIAKALWVQIEELMPPGSAGSPLPSTPQTAPPQAPPLPAQQRAQPAPPQSAPPSPQSRPSIPPQERDIRGGRDAAPPQTMQRPARPGNNDAHGARPAQSGPPVRRGGPDTRPARPPRPPSSPPKPLSEGQLVELMRLAARMEIEQAQFEEQLGKPMSQLNRTEAKDWIKRLRMMADEVAPSGRVRFGQWPGSKEDQEASYLEQQRDAGSIFEFKLFNGEVYTGKIVDFTPYTITVSLDGNGQEMVIRKLAIMYYRHNSAQADSAATPAATSAAASHPHDHPNDDLGSDRVGEPATPETDKMDEDRGV